MARILQVITSLRMGGAEKLVTELIPYYIKNGHQVDVVLFSKSNSFLERSLKDYGIKLYFLSSNTSVYDIRLIFKLKSIIKQYDIVHTHNTACQYYTAIAKRIFKFNKIKLVTTEHNTTNRRRNIIGFKFLDRWMYHQYNAIISISQKATENLEKYIGDGYPISTIYNGINIQKFVNAHPINKLELPNTAQNDIIICMVAGFRVQKDQDTLIHALYHLPNKYKLWLVGDGVRRKELECLTEKLGLKERILYWGVQTNVPEILKASDIVVMSSHWEGLSLSSLEGMCVGKPFVASDVDGLHEIVNGYGILFPHQDDKSLAKVLIHLMNDSTYYQQISESCMQRAKEFNIEKTAEDYLKVYQKILSDFA